MRKIAQKKRAGFWAEADKMAGAKRRMSEEDERERERRKSGAG
jgi:hypothetical protein